MKKHSKRKMKKLEKEITDDILLVNATKEQIKKQYDSILESEKLDCENAKKEIELIEKKYGVEIKTVISIDEILDMFKKISIANNINSMKITPQIHKIEG